MPETLYDVWVTRFWETLGIIAACIFYGRFYLQWIASEIKGRSVVPQAFWYMSAVGSIMLLGYAAYARSPVGALSHCFNIVVYTRNLVHIWRERGVLTPRRSWGVHAFAGIVCTCAILLAANTWMQEYGVTKEVGPGVLRRTWFWIAVGVAGQGLFACRFLLQWIVTEAKRKSVFPVAFWYISLAAAVLLLTSHLQRREWIFVFGVSMTLLVYARNLWFIHRHKEHEHETAPAKDPSAGPM